MKTQPHSIESEEAVLASAMLNRPALVQIIDTGLKPEHFFKDSHKTIYRSIVDLTARDGVADISEIEVLEELRLRGQLDDIGGISGIYAIQDRVESAVSAKYYAKIVIEKYFRRQLLRECKATIEQLTDGSDAGDRVDTIALHTIAAAQKVADGMGQESQIRTAEEIGKACIESLQERMNSPDAAKARVQTQIEDLNRVLPRGGLLPGQMIVIAARPSVGKTSLAMNFAEKAAVDDGVPVLVFSLEMSEEDLINRMMCSRARVDSKSVDNGRVLPQDQPKLAKAIKDIIASPLLISADTSPTAATISAHSRATVAQLGRQGKELGMIVVDYLQLMRGVDPKQRREQQISEMSRMLKVLAMELKVPIVVLSQLNRASEINEREPRLSDLRESGSIEQDADIVLLLHRGDQSEFNDGSYPDPDTEVIKIKHEKVRNGPIGAVLSTFRRTYTRFDNKY
ncbi:MAG: replicative DNA helicase [Gammaproteobacteria bacterium]|nr:replicative DNA helicase [Gammaproteobacteria bacterium]